MTNPSCPTCHNTHPDGSRHSNGVSQPVPRVASSLDDLRVGMWVVRWWDGEWHQPYEVTSHSLPLVMNEQPVVILSDPPPEPVTVSREAFDRLAEAANRFGAVSDIIGDDSRGRWSAIVSAARDVIREVRATP